jgi:hypothetical protein
VHIRRDKLDGRRHFGDDTVGFRDAIVTRLAEAFFMGHVADRADLLLDVTRTQPAIAMDTTMQVNKGVCVANTDFRHDFEILELIC